MIIPKLPSKVILVAATKKQPIGKIKEAISLGINDIGENYVQEAEKKKLMIGNSVRWHLIGHLQKNKVKKAVRIFDVIQTIDSKEIADLINKECEKIGKKIDVMIEVNASNESTKNGIKISEVDELASYVKQLPNLNLIGLMTMCKKEDFPLMRDVFLKSGLKYLSMGMSNDYLDAIKNGSNMVRLGTLIFGERK